jgi:CO dehydrogenase/acetyl-CoA synthase beta subunit
MKFNSQMKNLSKQDPEFYQYLKQNDKELLNAADDDEEEEEEEEEEEGEEEGDDDGEHGSDGDGDGDVEAEPGEIITADVFESMQAAVAEGGGKNLKALRALVLAFTGNL